MPKPLREQDIAILFEARDATTGHRSRTRVVEAFKRAGASVEYTGKNGLRVFFRRAGEDLDVKLPIASGEVCFDSHHKAWRSALSEMATLFIDKCGLEPP